jgi:hypothetical protein
MCPAFERYDLEHFGDLSETREADFDRAGLGRVVQLNRDPRDRYADLVVFPQRKRPRAPNSASNHAYSKFSGDDLDTVAARVHREEPLHMRQGPIPFDRCTCARQTVRKGVGIRDNEVRMCLACRLKVGLDAKMVSRRPRLQSEPSA